MHYAEKTLAILMYGAGTLFYLSELAPKARGVFQRLRERVEQFKRYLLRLKL